MIFILIWRFINQQTGRYFFFDKLKYDVTNVLFHKGEEISHLNGRLFLLVMVTDNINLYNQ